MVKTEFAAFSALCQNDADYAQALVANISMPIMDKLGISHEQACLGGATVMRHLFEVDVTGHPSWPYPNQDARAIPLCGDMAEALWSAADGD